MKLRMLIIGFGLGFFVAVVIGMTIVLPQSNRASRVNIDSDVHRPLEGALQYVEKSAAEGDCPRAAAQLRLLNKKFAEYRAGGPPPSGWYQDVIATTRPRQ